MRRRRRRKRRKGTSQDTDLDRDQNLRMKAGTGIVKITNIERGDERIHLNVQILIGVKEKRRENITEKGNRHIDNYY